jgi:hypothetical protein
MDQQERMEQLEQHLSADAIAAGDRRYVDDAHRVQLRVVALARGANASGAFENLYGFANHAALAVELARICHDNPDVVSPRLVDGVVAWRIRDERGLCAWLSEQRDCYLHAASREVGSAPGELAGLREQLATIYAVRELVIKLQIIPCSCSEIAVLLAYEQEAHLDAAWMCQIALKGLARPNKD